MASCQRDGAESAHIGIQGPKALRVFGSIKSAILDRSAAADSQAPAVPTPSASKPAAPTAQSDSASAGPASAAPKSAVDVTAVMDKLAGQSKEKLDWRRSIVDLMKLLDLDS